MPPALCIWHSAGGVFSCLSFEPVHLGAAFDSPQDVYKRQDIDKRIIRRAAESPNPEEKTLMWFCRPHGTHCLNENQVFIQGTRDHNTFRFYAEQTYDECVARVIIPKTVKHGKVFGDVFEINYREQAANVAQNSVAPDHDRLTFADGYVLDAPCRSSFDAAMALVGEHGGVKTRQTLPKDAEALAEVLSKQKTRRDRLPDAGRTETLSSLPVAELRKYEAVKKAHPDALVCFAQNGYFELYGKDAEKAAPLLGTKILEKKVRGKPSMPVTGFRETAWVAASKKLWQSGADVFLSKDGETFKELKAADYIPVGATLNVDGIKCRIDAVDFVADEVRLTNIEDKNRPIRFSESIQYVRLYVEDAGIAVYDTVPKKPTALSLRHIYDYYICNVKLENFNLSHVPGYIMSQEQLSMYATYMSVLGNREDLFGEIGRAHV